MYSRHGCNPELARVQSGGLAVLAVCQQQSDCYAARIIRLKGPNSDWIGGYPSVTQLNTIQQYTRKYQAWYEPSVVQDELVEFI